MRNIVDRLRNLLGAPRRIEGRLDRMSIALGRIESRQIATSPLPSPGASEFAVFSQWGEDGILDWLTRTIPIGRQIFVEFGVEDYREANTRFLLEARGWSGLILDSSARNIELIVKSDLYWRHNLKARAAFVTAENINDLILDAGLSGNIGLLSLDIDGNDYWVWKAIAAISPRIVVVEYNALLGSEAPVTIPYTPTFHRLDAHPGGLYFGASLSALAHLGEKKGYALVCCDSAGCNAFFVRKDVLAPLSQTTPAAAYTPPRFRQARDADGQLSYLGFEESREMIADMPLIDVISESRCTLRERERYQADSPPEPPSGA